MKLLIRIVQKTKHFAQQFILIKYIRKPGENINLYIKANDGHKQKSIIGYMIL